MRHTPSPIVLVTCLMVLATPAVTQDAVNNFDHFFALSVEQENQLGVITPPESAIEVARHRGVPILETASRAFTQDEIAEIKRYLDLVPAKMLETPPKAIVAASAETQGRIVRPNTVALASGPYIFLGNGFFEGGFRSVNTENDKVGIFMHEYTHVLQHYFLDAERGTQQSLRDRSSLVHDFAINVGWQAKDTVSGPYLSGENIAFAPENSYRGWRLPEAEESGTTKYGRTNNVEDQAESFGWVIAGHPDRLSEERVAFVLDFLGEDEEAFTQGVLPIHPMSLRANGQPRGSQRFFQDRTPDAFVQDDAGLEYYYFFDRDSDMPFTEALAYFVAAFEARGFSVVQDFEPEVLENKEDYASAVYAYGDMSVLIQIFDLTNAENYITKGEMTVRVAVSESEG